MATILIYAGVKGYKKYQLKRAKSAAEQSAKLEKNRNSISSLVVPSIASAHIVPGSEDTANDAQLPEYKEKASYETPQYTAPYSPDSIGAPARSAPPPPVMLGITLCESPTIPASELYGDSPIDYQISYRSELPGDSPFNNSSEVFELAGDEPFPEPISPAPLHVVKGGSSPLPPLDEELELTYSSDESEESVRRHHAPIRATFLEVPESLEDLLDFEAPPVPSKSSARNLRVVSS